MGKLRQWDARFRGDVDRGYGVGSGADRITVLVEGDRRDAVREIVKQAVLRGYSSVVVEHVTEVK